MSAGIVIGNTNNSLEGIDFVKRFKLHIHPRCVNTIKEIQGYSYRKDRNGNILDEPVKAFDHAMDAMRYAIYSHLRDGLYIDKGVLVV